MGNLWTWSMATPQNAVVALFVLTFVGNLLTRLAMWVAGPAAWGRLAARYPRVASFLLLFKAAGTDAVNVATSLFGIATGRLKTRADGGEVSPPPVLSPVEADKVLAELASAPSKEG